MDDTNPFGTFPTQSAPMFEDAPHTASDPANAPSPKRKSRRSRNMAAAPSQASSPKAAKRKYTRRQPMTQTKADAARPVGKHPALEMPYGTELNLVIEIVAQLRRIDPKTRARVMAAIGRLL